MEKKAKAKLSKKKIKGNNEDNYTNLLKNIDISLTKNEKKLDLSDSDSKKSYEEDLIKEDQILSVNDLLSNLEQKNIKTSKIKQQYSDLNLKGHKIQEAVSTRLQDQAERKANYKMVIKDVKKWQPIIKRNRETEHLDFTKNTKTDSKRINNIEFKPVSKNEFTSKLENKIKELNIENEADLKKQEEKSAQINPKTNTNELIKHKNLLFYQELKQKRLSKIKSKLYHKLKNKKLRQQQLKNNQLDPSFQANEIEKMTIQRAEERLSLRHKMKSKYVQNLIRYAGNKKEIKDSINEANQIRTELLKKIHEDPEFDNNFSDDENDEELKAEIIKELETEFLQEGEENKESKKSGLKFLENFVEKKKGALKNEATKLLNRLKSSKDIDNLSISSEEKEVEEKNESDIEELGEKNKHPVDKQHPTENEEIFQGRKKFIKSQDEKKEKKSDNLKISKELSVSKVLEKYINQNQNEEQNQNKVLLPPKEITPQNTNLSSDLIEGVNVEKLKKKYNKKINVESQLNNLENISPDENLETIYQNVNFNQVSDKMNEQEFFEEKINDMEIEDEKETKLTGWGSWAGIGIEKKNISEEEKAKKKQLEIEKIKKTRKDGNLDSVIINEKRNKNISKYLVTELPVPFKSKEQFNFLNNMPLGTEWNTIITHQNLTKPELKNKKGEIIDPIKYSKSNFSVKSSKK